jgi:hypothetical protein
MPNSVPYFEESVTTKLLFAFMLGRTKRSLQTMVVLDGHENDGNDDSFVPDSDEDGDDDAAPYHVPLQTQQECMVVRAMKTMTSKAEDDNGPCNVMAVVDKRRALPYRMTWTKKGADGQ